MAKKKEKKTKAKKHVILKTTPIKKEIKEDIDVFNDSCVTKYEVLPPKKDNYQYRIRTHDRDDIVIPMTALKNFHVQFDIGNSAISFYSDDSSILQLASKEGNYSSSTTLIVIISISGTLIIIIIALLIYRFFRKKNSREIEKEITKFTRQETGVEGSITTTGKKFTYKGVTYKWLYNYYNIGASSGEESPAKAGLVYASGGDNSVVTTADDNDTKVCPPTINENDNSNQNDSGDNNQSGNNNNNNDNPSGNNNSGSENTTPNTPTTPSTPTVSNKGANHYLNSLGAKVRDGSYVYGFSKGTTVGTIINKIKDSKGVSVLNVNNKGLGNSERIKTTDKIVITDLDGKTKYTYNVIIYGDVNGDGNITAGDYVTVKNHILGKSGLNGAKLKAADINRSSSVTAGDYVMIKNSILGKGTISQW